MSTFTLTLLKDFGDHLSPILVKELRQGLRTRSFTSTLIVFHSLVIVLFCIRAQGLDEELMKGSFWGSASLLLLMLMPLRAINELNSEAADGTLDMLTLTSISSFRIVYGKWLALFSQCLLVAGSLLPYIVARYQFGGVEVVRELVALFVLVLGSAVVTSVLLAFSSQKSVMLRVALTVLLGMAVTPVGIFTTFLVSSSDGDGMVRGFIALDAGAQVGIIFAVVAVCVYSTYYCLAMGASRIASPSENHSTQKRLIALIAHGVMLIIGLLLCYFSSDEENAFWMLMPLIVLTLITCQDILTEEMPRYPTAVAGLARRGRVGKLAGGLLHPGWASGVFFAAVLCALPMTLLLCIWMEEAPHDPLAGPLPFVLLLLLAAFVPTSLRVNRTNLFANWWVVQIVIVIASGLFCVFCEVLNSEGLAELGFVTPLTALFSSESVHWDRREGFMMWSALLNFIWLLAALVRAHMQFPIYSALEREARLLDQPPKRRAHVPAD